MRRIPMCNLWLPKTILLGLILLVPGWTGCQKAKAPQAEKFVPPSTFVADDQRWFLEAVGPSDSDNQKIGKFFKGNPDFLDSPQWTGQPDKYVAESSNRRMRFYWFSGSKEAPIWNGLDFDGSRMREFSGQGMPSSN